MGFFSNLRSANTWKTGKSHADNGNFEKALVYFDDSARMATDQKTLYSHRLWYHLTKVVVYSKSGQMGDAKDSYKKFMDDLRGFKEECEKTPGIGTATRFNTTHNAILEFTERNAQYVEPVESSLS